MRIMHLKGIAKIREKLPDYHGNRIALLPLQGLLSAVMGYVFLLLLDMTPRIFGSIETLVVFEPLFPILGTIFIAALGFCLIGRLWSKRDRMKEKYGALAYQKMIRTGVLGVFLILSLILHAFTSVRSLPPTPPVNELTILWSQSILPLLGFPSEIDILFRITAFGVFLTLGLLTVRSSLLVFGLDYMVVVYLYFPEESDIQENEIYSVVRHPAYMAGVLLGLAALAFRFSVYSMVICFIIYLVFRFQVRREEQELVDRFGESYQKYMEKVPPLHVRLKDIPVFLRFLKN